MLFKTSDNVEINYEVTGKGKTIVLVNGFGAYQEIWSAQVPFLNKLGYQVLTYDHRNMGKSQRTEKGHTIERLTQDLNELTSFLKIKQAIFMGHSMGASIIFCLMKNNPKLVKQALLIDQSPKMLNDENWKYGFMDYTKENYLKKCRRKGFRGWNANKSRLPPWYCSGNKFDSSYDYGSADCTWPSTENLCRYW